MQVGKGEGRDLWQSHIIRIEYGKIEELVRILSVVVHTHREVGKSCWLWKKGGKA